MSVNISLQIASVRSASVGLEVRESIASGLQAIQDAENQHESDVQTNLDGQNIQIAEIQTSLQNIIQNSGDSVVEIVDTRNGYFTLKDFMNAKAYDIKQFGVKGDNVTNETVEFNSAMQIISNAGGGVLYIPQGTYLIDNLELKNNVIIVGQDRKSSIIKLNNTSYQITSATGLTKTGLYNISIQTGDVVINANEIYMDNVYFYNSGLTLSGGSVAVNIGNIELDGNNKNVNGVYINSLQKGYIRKIEASNYGQSAIYIANSNNVVFDTLIGVTSLVGITISSCNYCTVKALIGKSNKRQGVILSTIVGFVISILKANLNSISQYGVYNGIEIASVTDSIIGNLYSNGTYQKWGFSVDNACDNMRIASAICTQNASGTYFIDTTNTDRVIFVNGVNYHDRSPVAKMTSNGTDITGIVAPIEISYNVVDSQWRNCADVTKKGLVAPNTGVYEVKLYGIGNNTYTGNALLYAKVNVYTSTGTLKSTIEVYRQTVPVGMFSYNGQITLSLAKGEYVKVQINTSNNTAFTLYTSAQYWQQASMKMINPSNI